MLVADAESVVDRRSGKLLALTADDCFAAATFCRSCSSKMFFCRPSWRLSDAMELTTETPADDDVLPTLGDNNCESIVLVLSSLPLSVDCEPNSGLLANRYDDTEAALRLLPARLTGAADVTGIAESSRSHSAVRCLVNLSSEIDCDDDFSYLGIFAGNVFGIGQILLVVAD